MVLFLSNIRKLLTQGEGMEQIKGFEDHLRFERRVAEGTIKVYIIIVNQFKSFISKPLEESTREDVRDFIKYTMNRGLNNSTVSNYIISLRCFYNYLADKTQKQEVISISFFLQKILKIKRDKTIPQMPNNSEWEKMRNAIYAFKSASSFNKGSKLYKQSLKDSAIFETLVATGVRASELANMRLCDFDMENNTIFIKCGKGGHQRITVFNSIARETILEYINDNKFTENDKIFGIKYASMLNYIIKKWAKRAGINPRLHPHSFRHYHITEAQRLGIGSQEVADQAGHVSLNTTRRYTHLDINHRREVYNKANF